MVNPNLFGLTKTLERHEACLNRVNVSISKLCEIFSEVETTSEMCALKESIDADVMFLADTVSPLLIYVSQQDRCMFSQKELELCVSINEGIIKLAEHMST